MEIKSFDTILTTICDDFDALLSPVKMTRANTNIFYLLFKAIAKGWEIMNNVCVVLNNKFNPLYCTDKDLESVGKLVGTKRRGGSVSGLRISAYNQGIRVVTLQAGTYIYTLSAEVSFSFTLTEPVDINAETIHYFTALSDSMGAYRVTQQDSILITSDDSTIPSELIFSCIDNLPLLGYEPETLLEFRQRVNTDIERQDIVNELKEKILALPYVYDCSVIFNQNESDMIIGEFTIKPYHLLIIISTALYTNEIAEIVASSAIYPTVYKENEQHEITSHVVEYVDEVFATGSYKVYLNDYRRKEFTINLNAQVDSAYNTSSNVKSKIENRLMNVFNSNIYIASITAEDVFKQIDELKLTGVKILSVSFEVDGNTLTYVDFDKTELPNLVSIGGI